MSDIVNLETGNPLTSVANDRRAMIIAEDAHVNYRVYASGKRVGREKLLSLNAMRGGRGLKTVPALRGVSFTAREGETIGVVGHNGSGKSTLFRAISGLIPTSEGAIWARERPVLLGVNAALVPELSGENNIKLGLLAMGFTPDEATARVSEIADFAELNEFIYHPMRTYSSGMGARLRFAIAASKAHSVLLIDEALAVGDRRFKAKSERRIRELRESAGVVMIVSHSVGSLKDTCERVLWIHKGELRADGPAGGVIDEYVKWTKDPTSTSVGAAFAPKPRTPVPVDGATLPVSPSDATRQIDSSLLEELFSVLPAVPGPPAVASTPETTSESSRTDVRRERYRELARQRRRRRIIAIVATSVLLLVAVGAGAAIALLSEVPAPQPAGVPSSAAAASDEIDVRLLAIDEFSASEDIATCPDENADVNLVLSWSVEDAVDVALASAPGEVDAMESPTQRGLAAVVDDQIIAFPCSQAERTYTLTAEGADGNRVSAHVVIERALEVSDATVEVDDSAEIDEDGNMGSVAPGSEPARPSPSEPSQPSTGPAQPTPSAEPTPDLEPTPGPGATPEPVPTVDPALPVEPELPQIPEPEPTDESSGGEGPIETPAAGVTPAG